jgi:hypothetical protein
MNRLWPPPISGRRGREIAQVELLLAGIFVFVLEPFLYIAAPGFMDPTFSLGSQLRLDQVVLVAGAVVAQLGGFAWMIRIYRADPEAGERTWRYHLG